MELWLELTTDVLTYLQKSLTPKMKTDDGDSQPRDVPSPLKRKRRKHIVRSPKKGSKKPRTMEHPPEERAEPAED